MRMRILSLFVCLWIVLSVQAQQAQANYNESKVQAYFLPPLLITQHGDTVNTVKKWEKVRKPEIINLFAQEVYGKTPEKHVAVRYKILSEKRAAFEGRATRSEVRIFLGKTDSLYLDVLIFLPNGKLKPVPVFVGYNFYGNHTILPDPTIRLSTKWMPDDALPGIVNHLATDSTRGYHADRWPIERILDRGYGVVTLYCGDVDPDYNDGFTNGVHPLFYDKGQTRPRVDQWGTIGAWAWGLSRVMDFIQTQRRIDSKQVVVIGHSRLAKAALWAAVQDDRFAIAISNNSGCGGAALSMRKFGETVATINTAFPHWFCDNFKKYNNQEHKLPIDQHMLLALIAPRPVYVASAAEDLWADPMGEFLATWYAGEVYRLYGLKPLPSKKMPEINKPITRTDVGYHIRSGKHDITLFDWECYMDFADFHFKLNQPSFLTP